MRCAGAVLVLLLSACGTDRVPEGDPWRFAGDAAQGDGVAEEVSGECVTDADCPNGQHCYHPETCGEPAYCVDGYSPCSAAPPFTVCTCDGRIDWASAGCPGPYAWNAENLAPFGSEGEPCDGTARPPFPIDVEFRVTDEVDGDRVLVRLFGSRVSTDEGPKPLPANRIVTFQATAEEFSSFGLAVLADLDGDGVCSPGIDAEYVTHELSREVNLETFEFSLEVGLTSYSEPCVNW